jgi:hypothetical protein
MSDNEVIVTIESGLLDFETTRKALGNVASSKPWQLRRAGLISGHKIGNSTVLQPAIRHTEAGSRELYSRAIETSRHGSVSIAVLHASASSSDVAVNAVLKPGHPTVSLAGRKTAPIVPTVDRAWRLP